MGLTMKNEEMECPCGSGRKYALCCGPFHQGALPESAVQLMRSRYSAYCLNLPDYLIQTTHPASPQFHPNRALWTQMISRFCQQTQFKKLEVLHAEEKGDFATVTFTAHLSQNKEDLSYTERSYFDKVKGRWLYRSGLLAEGHAPHLITTSQVRLLPLAYYGDPILRKVAEPIVSFTEDVRTLAEEMIEAIDAYDGVGIAAPQLHHSVRIFVIRAFEEREDGSMTCEGVKVMINPEISSPSAETRKESEGCLSIPTIHGSVERAKEITVEYSDLDGNRIKERLSGLQARIVQHENDHLNGILFIDRLPEKEKQTLAPFLEHLHKRIHDGTEL